MIAAAFVQTPKLEVQMGSKKEKKNKDSDRIKTMYLH